MVLCWIKFDNFQNKYVWVSDPSKHPYFSNCACAWHWAPECSCWGWVTATVTPLATILLFHFSLSFSQSLKVTITIPLPQLPYVIPVWWSFTPFLGLLLCLFSTWWFPGVEEHFHPLLMGFSDVSHPPPCSSTAFVLCTRRCYQFNIFLSYLCSISLFLLPFQLAFDVKECVILCLKYSQGLVSLLSYSFTRSWWAIHQLLWTLIFPCVKF